MERQAFTRVIALVVQPGVEFDGQAVFDYDRGQTEQRRGVIDDADVPALLVLEAHSSDYQTVVHLTQLVEDHWVVLKVIPGLTFALREALFALAAIEAELVPAEDRSHLVDVVDQVMVDQPKWWEGYYEGDDRAKALARRYSYSDRLRYYWPAPAIVEAHERLRSNLRRTGIPLPMLSAYLPGSTRASAAANWSLIPMRSPSIASATCCAVMPQPVPQCAILAIR